MSKRPRPSPRHEEPVEYTLSPAFAKGRLETSGSTAQFVRLVDALIETWLKHADGELGWLTGLPLHEAREGIYTLLEHGLVDIALRDSDDGMAIKVTPVVPAGMTEAEVATMLRSVVH